MPPAESIGRAAAIMKNLWAFTVSVRLWGEQDADALEGAVRLLETEMEHQATVRSQHLDEMQKGRVLSRRIVAKSGESESSQVFTQPVPPHPKSKLEAKVEPKLSRPVTQSKDQDLAAAAAEEEEKAKDAAKKRKE